MPDEKYGEEILACVIPRDPADPPDPGGAARASAAGGWRTTRSRAGCEILDGFPMTVSGKVRKVELRETGARESAGVPESRTDPDRRAQPTR